MAIIPTQNKYPDRAGYLGLDTERNVLSVMSDGIMKSTSVPEGWVNVKDFGAKGDGVTDDTIAFQNALNTGKTVFIPEGTFIVSNLKWHLRNNIFGSGRSTILKNIVPNSATFTVRSDGQWTRTKITNLRLYGNENLDNNGIEFYDDYGGRLIIDNIFFENFDKAIFKEYGNIGNIISNCTFSTANFHYYAQRGLSMQAGSDYFYNDHFNGAKLASIYFDNSTGGLAGITLQNVILEGNEGFGIFIKDFRDNGIVGTSLQSVHFEDNATATYVTINGITYTPRHIYIENSSHVIAYNSYIYHPKLINSNMVTYSCKIVGIPELINSSMVNHDVYGGSSVLINSFSDAALTGDAKAVGILLPPRDKIVHSFSDKILVNIPFDTINSWGPLGGSTSNRTSTQIEDSINHTYSGEFTIDPSSYISLSSFTVTKNKYTVIVGNIKFSSNKLKINWGTTVQRGTIYSYESILNQWISFAFLGYNEDNYFHQIAVNNDDTVPATFRINDFQILEFDTKPEALEFINSRMISDIVI